jgi:methylenetetrahydrofolate dehydrogenase (NADP+)/methenyltetrahydrofolate cyclohydrolase
MSSIVMYGKPVAEQITARLLSEVPRFVERQKVVPTLAIVQVGRNPASDRYIAKKVEACTRLGMAAEHLSFDETISADALKEEVDRAGRSPKYHGILVQLPLPDPIEKPETSTNKFDIFDVIPAGKDVDGVGRDAATDLYRARQARMKFLACTALAVRRMMAYYQVPTEGKRAVVIGRNDITAKPILHMLGGRMCNAAAIWSHKYVPQAVQDELIREADILVSSVGSSHFKITRDMVKPGVVVFDIATRVEGKKLKGDVDFEGVSAVASLITPVPGGVGPVTVAALTENLFRAAQFTCGIGTEGYTF